MRREPGVPTRTPEHGTRKRKSMQNVFIVGTWLEFSLQENELGCPKVDPTHGTELPSTHCSLANRWAYVQPSGVSLQSWEAEQMNRRRTPAQPFNYGKDGKGTETQQTSRQVGKEWYSLRTVASVASERQWLFQIKSLLIM